MTTSMNDTIAQGVEMERLEPCPFCGGKPEMQDTGPTPEQQQAMFAQGQDWDDGVFFVACQCTATGPESGDHDRAIAAWNRRAPSELLASRLAKQTPATHRHKKRGSEYVLIGAGKMQAEDWRELDWATGSGEGEYLSVDMREVAIYRSVDDGSLWVRPIEEFNDGRFEALPSPVGGTKP